MGGSMTKIMPGLYVGSWKNAKDEEELIANCITHILSVHDLRQNLEKSSSRRYLRIWASDTQNQDLIKFISQSNDFIHEARLASGNCLVHCMAGVSRSVTLCVTYIMTVTGLSFQEALSAVQGIRHAACPNEGFQEQMERFEREYVDKERNRLRDKYGEWNSLEEDLLALNVAIDTHQRLVDNGYYIHENVTPGGASTTQTKSSRESRAKSSSSDSTSSAAEETLAGALPTHRTSGTFSLTDSQTGPSGETSNLSSVSDTTPTK